MIAHIVQGGGYLGEPLDEELLRIDVDEEEEGSDRQFGVSTKEFMSTYFAVC